MKVIFASAFLLIAFNGGVPLEGCVINGEVAVPGQFTFRAEIFVDDEWEFCGGSILTPHHILTAASCVNYNSSVQVIIGRQQRRKMKDLKGQVFHVPRKSITVHDKWDPGTMFNNIAIIKLSDPIIFNELVTPIRLPKKSKTYPTYVGEETFTSGWGRINASDEIEHLQYINNTIMTNEACSLARTIDANTICVGSEIAHQFTCIGELGSPLVVHDAEGPLVAGVTSFGSAFGSDCATPAVFTRTTSYIDWIEAQIGVELRASVLK